MTRVARAFAAVIAAGIGLLVPSSPAAAETAIQVTAGYQGGFVPGRDVPVWVKVTADRLVSGTLAVSFQPGDLAPTITDLAIEVPGGSVKEFLIVVPTPESSDSGQLAVSLRAGDETVGQTADVEFHDDVELVGLLPGVQGTALPGASPITIDAGTARFAAVGEAELAAAPNSLAPLGTIVAGPDELQSLGAASLAGLVRWVEQGGRLLIDALPGTQVTGLPAAYQPGAGGRVEAGLGEVRLTGGAAAAGRWADIIEPTPLLSPNQKANLGNGFFGNEGVGDSVARDAGVQVARLGWLLLFLAGYVVVVGPLTFFLLRRAHRGELAWIAVPVLAVVFAGVAFVAGSDLRSGTRAASGSYVELGSEGASATTYVGVISRNGGDGTVSFPAGWVAGNVDTSFSGGIPTGAVQVVPGADGTLGHVALAAGQFGVVTARGPLALDGGLEVTATSGEDSNAHGTVHNTTPWDLEEVAVFVGRAGVNLGTVPAGGSKDWSVGAKSVSSDVFTPIEASVWADQLGFFDGRPNLDDTVNLAIWAEAIRAGGPNFRTPGAAVAVGWTRGFVPPADVHGQGDAEGRTALIARAPVTADGGAITDVSIRRDLLRGPAANDFGTAEARSVYRFVLPAAGTYPALELQVPDLLDHVDAWDGGAWRVIDDTTAAPNKGDPSRSHPVAVPASAVRAGVVYLRVGYNPNFGMFDASGLMLRAAA